MSVQDAIKSKLTNGLSPAHLVVEDQSHHHAGHAGHNSSGESHFHIEIVSAAFAGKSRVDRHRMVNTLLAEELDGPIHALTLSTRTPEDAA